MRAAPDEDRQLSEEPLFFRRQQLVRPFDRRPQSLLTWICVTTAFEQVEALAESLEQLVRREELRPCRRQFERQRQVVETFAQLAYGAVRW